MKSWRWFVACLVLLGISAAVDLAGAAAREEAPRVGLERLRDDPLAYLGAEVRIVVQHRDELAGWNPYLTRFGSDEYHGFRAWADEQILWRKEDWEQPAATLFVRRGALAAAELGSAPRYTRYEATAHVRQVFLGRPWIEVASVRRLPDSIGEGTILHASRALERMDEGRFQVARDDLDRALPGEMPETARLELRRLSDLCDKRERP